MEKLPIEVKNLIAMWIVDYFPSLPSLEAVLYFKSIIDLYGEDRVFNMINDLGKDLGESTGFVSNKDEFEKRVAVLSLKLESAGFEGEYSDAKKIVAAAIAVEMNI